VLVGEANEHRTNFFDLLQSSKLLLEDYPELLPLILKRKQPQKQQRLDDRVLEVYAKDDRGRIVFPTFMKRQVARPTSPPIRSTRRTFQVCHTLTGLVSPFGRTA
jgi:hypothetical protein